VMPICGDDAQAKAVVTGLGEQLGFEMVDVGGLDAAHLLEAMALVWVRLSMLQGLGRGFAFRLVRR
jgi:predicted dinucleotide-binding enzyme